MLEYQIEQITDWYKWESLVLQAPQYSFLQSWQLGSLSEQLDNKVYRFGLRRGDQHFLLAQVLIIEAKRGKLLQVRHGPLVLPEFHNLIASQKIEVLSSLVNHLKQLGKAESCDYIRLQPLFKTAIEDESNATNTELELTSQYLEVLEVEGFKPASIHNIDAEKTLILDITPKPEVLLENMRKQTRYYVRKAEKSGVTVTHTQDSKAIEQFFSIHHDTTLRQSFKSYSLGFYQKFFAQLNSLPESKLSAEVYLADYQGQYIAAAIIVYYAGKAFYSDGGSLSAYSKIPASYLIQWTALKRAKDLGCSTYNLWGGVSPDKNNTKYPWYGIDLFKRGFAGTRVDYVHAFDQGLGWKYSFIRLFELWEKLRRGY